MAGNTDAIVYKTFEDGYTVRQMTANDAKIVQKWYGGMGKMSKYDLNTSLEVYPPGNGFYIGEYNGEVVASAIRIPWAENVFYGSLYYVDGKYRGKGFGTRLRDQVAREYVGDNHLCIDSVTGKVARDNENKFEYKYAFNTCRYEGIAKDDYGIQYGSEIIKATDFPLEQLIQYDNKCFISKNNPIRKAFITKWIHIPDGDAYVALSKSGEIEGYGCRRPCLQNESHMIGPLYADNAQIAEYILQKLCGDVKGESVTINIWHPNKEAVDMVGKFDMKLVFEVYRMHVNGNPDEYKKTTFALTSIDVCGF